MARLRAPFYRQLQRNQSLILPKSAFDPTTAWGVMAQVDKEDVTLASVVKPANNETHTPATEAEKPPDQDQLAGEQPPRKLPPPSPTRSNLSAMSPVSLSEAEDIPWKGPAAEPGNSSGGVAPAAIGVGRRSDGDGDSDSGGGRPSEKGLESGTTVVCSGGLEGAEAEEREEQPKEVSAK